MPRVQLPTTFAGWLATLAASAVGFFSGAAVLHWLGKAFR